MIIIVWMHCGIFSLFFSSWIIAPLFRLSYEMYYPSNICSDLYRHNSLDAIIGDNKLCNPRVSQKKEQFMQYSLLERLHASSQKGWGMNYFLWRYIFVFSVSHLLYGQERSDVVSWSRSRSIGTSACRVAVMDARDWTPDFSGVPRMRWFNPNAGHPHWFPFGWLLLWTMTGHEIWHV